MASKTYPIEPQTVPTVETKYRRIVTPIPAPESVPVLEHLRTYEPACMEGQPTILWDRAEGFQIYDKWGNMWIDFSSGVLITNAGHAHPKVVKAITDQAQQKLLTNYCFPNEQRARLAKKLVEVAPKEMTKAFILSTGSEATECAIKLMRTRGITVGGTKKIKIVSFERAFHGRTMGSQQIGGIPALKEWIVNLDPAMVQVPFPDGYRTEDVSFELFERCLKDQGVSPDEVAGVILETYQGGGADFAPTEYMQALRKWCDTHNAALTCDEVQAGFGRCGTMWGFEHYGIVPDLMCLGKGISSSLPVSAVVGKPELMNQYGPGTMTSTHTGNPICAAAAVASIEAVQEDNLVQNARTVGERMQSLLDDITAKYDVVGCRHGKGMVAGLQIVKPGTKEPDADLAWDAVKLCIEKGVMFFAPVGFGGATIKISPPLCITAEAMEEAIGVIDESIAQAIAEQS